MVPKMRPVITFRFSRLTAISASTGMKSTGGSPSENPRIDWKENRPVNTQAGPRSPARRRLEKRGKPSQRPSSSNSAGERLIKKIAVIPDFKGHHFVEDSKLGEPPSGITASDAD